MIVNLAPALDTKHRETAQTRIQIVSPALRRMITTTQYLTSSALLTSVHICISGELVLPSYAYVCDIEVVNDGVVRGVSNLTECPQSGGYFDSMDSKATMCGGASTWERARMHMRRHLTICGHILMNLRFVCARVCRDG